MFKILLERKGFTEQEIIPAREGFRFTYRPEGEETAVASLEFHCWWAVESLAAEDLRGYEALCATVPAADEVAVLRLVEDGREVTVFRGKVSEMGQDGVRLFLSAEQAAGAAE